MEIGRPEFLSDVAALKWDELMPHLLAMGTLKATDVDLLAAYCESYARWRRLVRLAANSAPVFKRHRDGEDVMVKNPVYGQVRDATAELRVLAREFGFTPSARSGLRVEIINRSGGAERLLS